MILTLTHNFKILFYFEKATCVSINAVDCGNLTNPVNGRVQYDSTKVNSIATYNCNADCDLNITRVCQKNGTWSGEEPVCPGAVNFL